LRLHVNHRNRGLHRNLCRSRRQVDDNISNMNVFLDKVLDDSGRKSIVFEPLQSRVNEVVKHCIENFGPEKCFWGSDWPVSLHCSNCDLRKNVEIFKTSLKSAKVNPEDIEKIFNDNAKKFYGI